ncbi:carbohydrate-binding domain-containing protein [Demequina sp.]|uniref:carbohydrate-binding domain-containing protein n=1 Tax=Demequina sp. TaxID=2050685 RepID=UPI003A87FEB9
MNKPTLYFASLVAGTAMLLSACSPAADDTDSTSTTDQTTDSSTAQTSSDTEETVDLTTLSEATYVDLDVEDMDLDVSSASVVDVTLADGASSGGDGVSVDGDVVTITAAGVYRLSGTLTDGKIVVNADGEDVHLILDGVDITSSESGAIEVVAADQVALHLADGTSNTVAEAAGAAESAEGANAAIYASSDLYITGEGSLDVTSTLADGITSKDSLVIDSGDISVSSVDDGVRGKDHLVIRGGSLSVDAGGDALRSDNIADADEPDKAVGVIWIEDGQIDLTAVSDAIDAAVQATIVGGSLTIAAEDDAIHADGILRIDGGTIDVTSSYEGFEAGVILLSGGEATMVSSDDAFNATDGSGSTGMGGIPGDGGGPGGGGGQRNGASAEDAATADETADETAATVATVAATTTAAEIGGETGADGVRIEVSGGTWILDASGDGVDSNGTIEMTGGTVVVAGPTNSGNGALDYDQSFTMDGGVFIATGAAGMAMAPSDGTQAVVGVSFGQTVAAGEAISVLDADGNLVASYTSTKDSQTVVLSSPDLVAGDTYTVTFGGTVTGESTGGLVTDGTVSGGETAGTVEAS